MWCGRCAWSNERRLYHDGKVTATKVKFHLAEEQQEWLQRRLQRDTDWLISHGLVKSNDFALPNCSSVWVRLMDYSLVVGTQQLRLDQLELAKEITCMVLQCYNYYSLL